MIMVQKWPNHRSWKTPSPPWLNRLIIFPNRHEIGIKEIFSSIRQSIIDGLKKNWEELHHQYQGLSVVTDTAPKKARKERMETEMKQLERDIETIEKHKIIYIAK